jgi:hypothetical protein
MSTTRRTFLSQMGTAGIVSIGATPPAFLAQAARAAEKQPMEKCSSWSNWPAATTV